MRSGRKLLFGLAILGSLLAGVLAPNYSYAAGSCTTGSTFMNLPTWFKGLPAEEINGECVITTPGNSNELRAYFWTVALNITSIIFGVAGYLAVLFVMIGGIRIMTSAGNPAGMVAGRKTITNALIGVVICALASTLATVVNSILHRASSASNFFVEVANVVLIWTGIIAVVMIIIGGINFMVSTGDLGKVRQAKNTIVYALVGLVITVLAAAIVNTVLGAL